jgi:hypothetical protein
MNHRAIIARRVADGMKNVGRVCRSIFSIRQVQPNGGSMKGNNVRLAVGVMSVMAIIACTENPTAVGTPDISVRLAKPGPGPAPSAIAVTYLGSLPVSRTIGSGAPIGLSLNTGSTRSATRVAGYTGYGTTIEYPFTWTAQTGMVPLSVIEEGYSWPTGVSANGVIAGEFSNANGNRAFVVSAGGPMTFLPVPSGTTFSGATGITADGTCISGRIQVGGTWYAVIWRNRVLETVGVGNASGVSDDCTIVSGTQGGAVVWRKVSGAWTVETLSAQGSSETTDISPNAQYVAGRRVSEGISYAVIWHYSSTGWTSTDMPGSNWYAFGVTNLGRAVGNNNTDQPVVWTPDSQGSYSAQVLPPLERSRNGWAAAINELGQVSGRSGYKPVLWTLPN